MIIGKFKVERADKYNITVERETKNKKTGEAYFTGTKYFSRWEGAMLYILEQNIKDNVAQDILDSTEEAKKIIKKNNKK